MPLSYRFYDETLLLIRGAGQITQQERINALRRWRRDPAYDLCTDALLDFTLADSTPRVSDVRELVRVMREDRPGRGPKRLALVTPRPIAFGIARVFEEFVRFAGFTVEVRAFRQRQTAWAWLKPDVEPEQLDLLSLD